MAGSEDSLEARYRGALEEIVRLRQTKETLERQLAEYSAVLQQTGQRLGDFIEVSDDWIWETDTGHRFSYFDGRSIADMARAGVAPELSIGKTRWELAGASLDDEIWRRHKADLDAHRPVRQFRYFIDTPSGGRRHFSISGKPVFDATGKFRGYRGIANEETAVIEARERAERAEALLRDAVDSISEGLVLFDREDRFLMCNDAYRAFFGEDAVMLQPGVRFEDILRARLKTGRIVAEPGREEEWLAERMRYHRGLGPPYEQLLKDGRWMLITERRMRNGGIAGLRIEVTALKVAQIALRESEERLDRAQAIAGIGSWELDIATGRISWSMEMFRLLRAPREVEPSLGRLAPNVDADDLEEWRRWLVALQSGRESPALEYRLRLPDGQVRLVSAEGRPVADDAGKVLKIAGTLQDVTERRSIERQLVQAQKMEAIGNLTGGMAHDFNNLLAVIIGNLDLLQNRLEGNPQAAELAKAALGSALRGADLTRRLLAFARRQPLHAKRIDINDQVAGMVKLLARTLGEEIEVELKLAAELWPAAADPAQLEAAILNLATNARDAMPRGGRLAIATLNAHLDDDYAAHNSDVTAGDYVAIEVSDSGTGISRELLGRIFEPFFTTKEPGKGTGLGLSMVFGFMKQSGGHINVYSEPGIGTTFRLYLPRSFQGAAEDAQRGPVGTPARGAETVLVVEDNASLRQIVLRQLGDAGYRVLQAENGRAALDILESAGEVALLLSDIVMPGGMDGRELARIAKQRRPRLKVLLTSGFPEARVNGDEKPAPALRLLSKPYRKEELLRVVREAIDE